MQSFLGRAGELGWARRRGSFLLCVALVTGLLTRSQVAQAATPTETDKKVDDKVAEKPTENVRTVASKTASSE